MGSMSLRLHVITCNTFANCVLMHFTFVAAPHDFKSLLGGYTFISGPPYMPPIYALGLGDSDCYLK